MATTDGRKALLKISVRTVQRDVLVCCEACAGPDVAGTLRQELSAGGVFHFGETCRRCALRRSACTSASDNCNSQQKPNRQLKNLARESTSPEPPSQVRGFQRAFNLERDERMI